MNTRAFIRHSLTAAWPLAVSVVAALSQPRTDVEASDAAFDALMRDSALAHWAGAVARAVGRAWTHSRARSVFERSAVKVRALSGEQAIRTASWTVVVASMSALLLDAIKPTPVGPLAWVLPALFAAASIAALCAAGPLARALGDRQP